MCAPHFITPKQKSVRCRLLSSPLFCIDRPGNPLLCPGNDEGVFLPLGKVRPKMALSFPFQLYPLAYPHIVFGPSKGSFSFPQRQRPFFFLFLCIGNIELCLPAPSYLPGRDYVFFLHSAPLTDPYEPHLPHVPSSAEHRRFCCFPRSDFSMSPIQAFPSSSALSAHFLFQIKFLQPVLLSFISQLCR